jgi:death-on-curing protein
MSCASGATHCANLRSEPTWIEEQLLRTVQEEQLAEHGGMVGIRDANLLASALARPRNLFAYEENADLAALAAAYGIGLVRNHPFLDGNKRAGLIAVDLFLRLNGSRLTATNAEAVIEILALAAGERTDDAFTEWVRDHAAR